MPRIVMIARMDFEWQGEAHASGHRFDVPPAHAAALYYQRKARFATDEDDPPLPPIEIVTHTQALDATVSTPARKPRKPRKRRDIRTPQHTKD